MNEALTFGPNMAAMEREIPSQNLLDRIAQLEKEKRETEKRVRKLERDSLTNCYVRQVFNERFDDMIAKGSKQEVPVGYLQIDVDHFKKVNDIYGHQAGDAVLAHIAGLIGRSVRSCNSFPDLERRRGQIDGADDLVGKVNEESVEIGRVGGEEFGVALYNVSENQACAIAERVRKAVEGTPYKLNGKDLHITLSVGVATTAVTEATHDDLYRCADRALYSAKDNGRNCTVRSSRDGPRLVSPHRRVGTTEKLDSAHLPYSIAS